MAFIFSHDKQQSIRETPSYSRQIYKLTTKFSREVRFRRLSMTFIGYLSALADLVQARNVRLLLKKN